MYQYRQSYRALAPRITGAVFGRNLSNIDLKCGPPIRANHQAKAVAAPTVFIISNDIAERDDLEAAVCDAGCRAQSYAFDGAFPAEATDRGPRCLVLDASLAASMAPLLLAAHHPELPVICLAARGDVPTTVRAMKAGALDVFEKPIRTEELMKVVRHALDLSAAALSQGLVVRQLQERYGLLSQRERQVMALVVSGLLNKQVAGELGISEVTVKQHRGNVMRKMKAGAFANLVKIAAQLQLASAPAESGSEGGILTALVRRTMRDDRRGAN